MAYAISLNDRHAAYAAPETDESGAGVIVTPTLNNPYPHWCENVEAYPLAVLDGQHYRAATADQVLEVARRILRMRLNQGPLFEQPAVVKDYLRVHCRDLEHEVFIVLFVDAQLRLISVEDVFRGTLAQTTVYPREIVKLALARNAYGVIFAHNHPSGSATPSRADEMLTQALKAALNCVDVKVLDHLVVTNGDVTSFAERGLL